MEKGTLIILRGKKGFNAKISFTKRDGKTAEIPVLGYYPPDEKYNNTECTFRRDKGQLLELIAHDGAVLLGAISQPAKVSTGGASHYQQNGIADSYDPSSAFLPSDTIGMLNRMNSPDNFALKLDKIARFDERMNKFQFFKRERKGENYEIKANYGSIDFQQIAAREHENAKSLLTGKNIIKLELTTDWRMVQGLGIESVYETSMTLHHVYGIPYIPASALKGVVRGWIITEVFDSAEEKAISDPMFCDWFGCPGELLLKKDGKKLKFPSYYKEARQGSLVFFDVFPLTPPQVVVDVMNPHYQQYYSDNSGKTPPADYLSPNPVFFLTIENTRFQVLVGSREIGKTIGGKNLQNWISDALTQHGIGAKTAVGYGYFKTT